MAGNSALPSTTRNALIAMDLFGLHDVLVHSGSAVPVNGREVRYPEALRHRFTVEGLHVVVETTGTYTRCTTHPDFRRGPTRPGRT